MEDQNFKDQRLMQKLNSILNEESPKIFSNATLIQLVTEGTLLSRADRLALTRALLEKSRTALIVDAKATDPEKDWSDYWKVWLIGMKGQGELDYKHCVLVNDPINEMERRNLELTDKFLKDLGLSLFTHKREDLIRSVGSELPQFDSINIFGRFVLTVRLTDPVLSSSYKSERRGFSGLAPLLVQVHDRESSTIYQELCTEVERQIADGSAWTSSH